MKSICTKGIEKEVIEGIKKVELGEVRIKE